MSAFAAVLKNNFFRLAERKSRLFTFLFLTACSIAAALFINANAKMAGSIAVIQGGETALPAGRYSITRLDRAPPLSELVAGKYDAVVVYDGQGGREVRTIKNDGFRRALEAALDNPLDAGEGQQNQPGAGEGQPDQPGDNALQPDRLSAGADAVQAAPRGPGANIVGFMMMFVLMQGVFMTFMFAEDKEGKQIRRVAASPAPFPGYLAAHGLFAFAALLAPAMAMLAAARLLPGVGIGLGLPAYLLVLSLLCALSTAFALFLFAFFSKSDSANMANSAIVVLSSILAGSFYSFDKGNRVLEAAIKVLPQKSFLTMSEMLEQGKGVSHWFGHGLYVAALAAFFFAAAVVKTRKDY